LEWTIDRTNVKHWGEKQREDEDDEEDVSSYWINFEQRIILEIKIQANRSTSVENFFLEWTMDETDVSN
jgi:hypothetical protein